jgi:Icc-related predicted phosphoesterase
VQHFGGRATIAEELAQAPVAPDPWILVAHTPPYDSALDRLFNVPAPIGSRAVRRFIEERRPLVALHGHCHESPLLTGRYTERVGTTLCINPGQGNTRLHAVLFESERPAETLRHTVFGAP